jgi:3-methyladenine DNA glycosylase AlkC
MNRSTNSIPLQIPIAAAPRRKGSIRMADIPPEIRQALNDGSMEAVTLVEVLVVDYGKLLRIVAPDAGHEAFAEMDETMEVKITARMKSCGQILLRHFKLEDAIARFVSHRSDTVRGWAAAMIGAAPNLKLTERLKLIAVLADDPNPGTREWAWMAVRPHIAQEVSQAIKLLTRWTTNASPNIRRFATEATRPRGVWCSHIQTLKDDPGLALPLLDPLRSDETKYVQDSVANWLNDASKSQPAFVMELCDGWIKDSPTKATKRICQRALRSIKP